METSMESLIGRWKVCGWVPTDSSNDGLVSLIAKDDKVHIVQDTPATCSVRWSGVVELSTEYSISSLTYDSEKKILHAGTSTVKANNVNASTLSGATVGLVCEKLLAMTMTLSPDNIGEGNTGTFIAEADPPPKGEEG